MLLNDFCPFVSETGPLVLHCHYSPALLLSHLKIPFNTTSDTGWRLIYFIGWDRSLSQTQSTSMAVLSEPVITGGLPCTPVIHVGSSDSQFCSSLLHGNHLPTEPFAKFSYCHWSSCTSASVWQCDICARHSVWPSSPCLSLFLLPAPLWHGSSPRWKETFRQWNQQSLQRTWGNPPLFSLS